MNKLPVLSIKGEVVVPGVTFPLRIGRAQNVASVDFAHKKGDYILAVLQRSDSEDGSFKSSDLSLRACQKISDHS